MVERRNGPAGTVVERSTRTPGVGGNIHETSREHASLLPSGDWTMTVRRLRVSDCRLGLVTDATFDFGLGELSFLGAVTSAEPETARRILLENHRGALAAVVRDKVTIIPQDGPDD